MGEVSCGRLDSAGMGQCLWEKWCLSPLSPSQPPGVPKGCPCPEQDPSAGLGMKELIKGFLRREIPYWTPNLDALGCRSILGQNFEPQDEVG